MSVEEWKSNVRKKIYFMTKNVWNGLNQNDVDRFLSNFKNNSEVGLALMEMLIFYSQEQEVQLASSVFKKMKREIWLKYIVKKGKYTKNSNYINAFIKDFLSDACFVPLENEDSSGSAYSLASIYKQIENFPREIEFIQIQDIPLMLAMKKRCIVFYDDVIGTGTQFGRFWNEKYHFEKSKITLNKLAEKNKDTQFFYLVFGANKKKLEGLRKKFPCIIILSAELYEEEDSVLNENNEYWELNPDIKNKVISYICSKMEELNIKNKFSCNIAVLFQHCRAQNTSLPLYWWSDKNENWKELYKR